MKKWLHPFVLVPLTAMATAAVVALPQAGAQQQAPAQPLVTGLPDFSRLVDEVGPGVVSVEAKIPPRRADARGGQLPPQVEEMLRRFGMPVPPGGGAPGASQGGVAVGTGFVISADGYLLTNRHVVDGAEQVKVRFEDRRELIAKVVGSDQASDVALLKVEGHAFPALRVGDSSKLRAGEWVMAIGSPFGLDHSVTAGIVSAVGRSNPRQSYVPFIQTDVAINRGNSGGPLLNTRGEVIGINSQIFSNSGGYQGVSFAIPMDTAMSVVAQLKSGGRVERGLLGVNMQPLDNAKARALGLSDQDGALVADVGAGSGAEKAGIRPGDVIRSFNGERVRDIGELPPLVGTHKPGTRVMLGVWRDGKLRDIPVVLGNADPVVATARTDGDATATAPALSNQASIGLRLQELGADDRGQLGLRAGQGVGIVGVESAAAREAGLVQGDVLLDIQRRPVGNMAQVREAMAGVRKGDTVLLRVRGEGGIRFVTVKAG